MCQYLHLGQEACFFDEVIALGIRILSVFSSFSAILDLLDPTRRGGKRRPVGPVLLALLLVMGGAGCKNSGPALPASPSSTASQEASSAFVPTTPSSSPVLVSGLPDFTPLVDRVGPSVVNIRVMERIRKGPLRGQGSGDPMEELLRRFFGIEPQQIPRRNQPLPEGGDERPTGIG